MIIKEKCIHCNKMFYHKENRSALERNKSYYCPNCRQAIYKVKLNKKARFRKLLFYKIWANVFMWLSTITVHILARNSVAQYRGYDIAGSEYIVFLIPLIFYFILWCNYYDKKHLGSGK